MPQAKGLVLISGINGYIASQCAKAFLDAGYSVRGTVRLLGSAQRLFTEAFKSYAEAGKFEVAEVPDITVAGAFDEAVKDVSFILHAASPLGMSFTDPDPVLHTAVVGTTTILESAYQYAGPQLQSVIVISSIAAVSTRAEPPYTYTEKDWNHWAEQVVKAKGKDTPGPITYVASKTAAEKAFWKFKEEKKPDWKMVSLNPVFVIGPAILPPVTAATVPATTQHIFSIFRGDPLPPKNALLPQNVDVRDVAALAVGLVSRSEGTDGERYIASGAVSHPQAIADILRARFPESRARIQEGTPREGYAKGYQGDAATETLVDSGKARKLIGRDWTPFEQSIVDTALSFEGLI